MAWSYKNDWVTNPRNPTNTDLDNIAKDQGRSGVSSWGGDVDAGSHKLLNSSGVLLNTGASIGLGESSPVALVALKKAFGTTEAAITIQANTASATLSAIQWLHYTGSESAAIKINSNSAINFFSSMSFEVNSGSGALEMMRLGSNGLSIGITSPTVSGTGLFHHHGDTARIVDASNTPANSAAAGNDGEVRMDNSFVYVHTGGSWRRAALSTF